MRRLVGRIFEVIDESDALSNRRGVAVVEI